MNKFRLNSDNLFKRIEEDNALDVTKIVFLSVEGNKTEQDYFLWIEKYKKECNLNARIQVHALKRSKSDGRCGVNDVLELLEEYIEIRDSEALPEYLRNLIPEKYDDKFIDDYLKDNIQDKSKIDEFENDLEIANIDISYVSYLKKIGTPDENDTFGIVLDRDYKSHTIAQLNNILKICKEKNIKLFLSNPCFEFWLLLHVSDVKNEYSNLELFLNNDYVSNKYTYAGKELNNKTGIAKTISEQKFKEYFLNNLDKAVNRSKDDFQNDLCILIGNDENMKGEVGTNLYELISLLK